MQKQYLDGKQHRAIETIKLKKKNYVVFASQIVPKKAPQYVKRKKMDDKENTSHIVFLKRQEKAKTQIGKKDICQYYTVHSNAYESRLM